MPRPAGATVWFAGVRPRTLPAAVVPVLVGTAAAANGELGTGRGIVGWRFCLALVVSLALQIGVNFANDYSDGVRGTDDSRVGPLRLVGSGLVSPGRVRAAAFASFGVAACAGLALAVATSWWLIAVGAASILAGWFYTGGPRPYGYVGLGEVFVFVFFGLVATVGSTFVQTEELDIWPVVVATPVGLLATALLVTNNLRDIPTDAVAEKLTLAVRLGDAKTRLVYIAMLTVAFALIVVVGVGWRPWALLGLAGAILAARPIRQIAGGVAGLDLVPVLTATGRIQLGVAVGLTIGLWFGG